MNIDINKEDKPEDDTFVVYLSPQELSTLIQGTQAMLNRELHEGFARIQSEYLTHVRPA